METHDVAALKGLIWLIVIVWWIWRRRLRGENVREPVEARQAEESYLDRRPRCIRYSCAPTGQDRLLVGVRLSTSGAEESAR
jgi:hypothetical protein